MSKDTKLPEPLFSRKPDFINEEGTRWWKDDILTRHAEEKLGKNYRVYAAQSKTSDCTYLLLDDTNKPLADTPSYEGMSYKIDFEFLRRTK